MKAKQEPKEDKTTTKETYTKNKANLKTERQKHETWKQKKNRIIKETTKHESNLGFKNGMLGKFVWKKQANIRKGKGKKNNDKINQK